MTPFERRDMPWLILVAAGLLFFVALAVWLTS
jgi:hypothetical protein